MSVSKKTLQNRLIFDFASKSKLQSWQECRTERHTLRMPYIRRPYVWHPCKGMVFVWHSDLCMAFSASGILCGFFVPKKNKCGCRPGVPTCAQFQLNPKPDGFYSEYLSTICGSKFAARSHSHKSHDLTGISTSLHNTSCPVTQPWPRLGQVS